MKQETCLKKCGTSMIAAIMILVTLLYGLTAFDAFVGEVSAGGGNFAGGDGTADNPYQIEDVFDLQNMETDLSAHYVLVHDIDASATKDWNNGLGFEPIGGELYNWFTGSLDGQGNNITGLFINRTFQMYLGMFGWVEPSGSVSNINLVNADLRGGSVVGGLVGENLGTVENCSVTGNVRGGDVGGLVGSNQGGMVLNSYTAGNVSGGGLIGGLVGRNEYGSVENSFYCISYTTLNGKNIVAPYGIYEEQFEDWLDDGTLDVNDYLHIVPGTDCYDIGSIGDLKNLLPFAMGDNMFRQTADIDLSTEPKFYIPFLEAAEYDGRGHSIIGLNLTHSDNHEKGFFGKVGPDCRISNISLIDYDVTGDDYVGGLVGENWGTVENCSATDGVNDGDHYVGGLVGFNGGTVRNSYATGDVRGNNDIGGLVGYIYDGTVENSYATGKVSGSSYVGGLVGNNNHGKVTNCSATGDVSDNGDNIGGLVGKNRGTVQNCSATGDVRNNGDRVGGLVGYNSGTVQNCSAAGDARNNGDRVGGLVGWNKYGIVKNCRATGKVSGNDFVGGLVGYNDGTLENCHATGKVRGEEYIGWLVGRNHGTIENCTATGGKHGSFLSRKIGPLPLYTYLVFVIIGIAAGAGALKMKGGKSGGEAQKPEQSQ